mmetsp:Transcript_30222/g.61760  ORF Transcript_30222/g.61760 Transcript_30222/m.61760 type:complete len:247 (-) Transcript_30222:367-1107(-)
MTRTSRLILLLAAATGAAAFSPSLSAHPSRISTTSLFKPSSLPQHNHSTNSQTKLSAISSLPFEDLTTLTTALSTTASSLTTSPPSIQTAFTLATFLPQPLWLLLILLPKSPLTKSLFSTYTPITICSLLHLFIVLTSITQPSGTAPLAEFADVFDPSGNPQNAMMGMMKYPNFVTEEWSHVLTWDLFVGRWIWLDGLKRGIFTAHSVLLCNLIGPPGLLLHFATCLVTGKGLAVDDVAEAEGEEG